jgi:CheY-like chemotaxis protein
VSELILVVDDEADIGALFRQQFRRDLKAGRFGLEFATSAQQALRVIQGAEGRDVCSRGRRRCAPTSPSSW